MEYLFFLIIPALIITYVIVIYNNLVRLRENVKKAWANIDVLLKQRHDELPKLIDTCKEYMSYEKETLESIVQARSAIFSANERSDMKALGAAEGQLRMGLGNLFAVAEQYPELKSSEKFQHLQARISNLEESIADRREFYNESVNVKNVRLGQFPDNVVGGWFGFKASDLLEFEASDLKDIDISAGFKK